jgi:hypothetical protein
MAEAGLGKIWLFNDFFGVGDAIALTADSNNLGDFYVGGEGVEDNDAGVAANTALLGGVVTITSANVNLDTTFIGTSGEGLNVGLMGPIVMETRIQMPDLDTKQLFFGLTSVCTLDQALEDTCDGTTTTITLSAGSLCGFLLASTLDDGADWHGVYNGGTTAGETTSTAVDLDNDAVAGEWQTLRLEVDTNGTARWIIDNELVQTVVGAISTTTNVGAALMSAATTTEFSIIECDYMLVTANRDWTV